MKRGELEIFGMEKIALGGGNKKIIYKKSINVNIFHISKRFYYIAFINKITRGTTFSI